MILAILHILISLLALITGYLVCRYLQNSKLYNEAAELPGPPTLPIIGNAHHFMGSTRDIFNAFTRQMDSYASPFRLWLADRLVYVIYDPENMKTVLTSLKTLDRIDEIKFFEPWFGKGLLTATGTQWKNRRKLLRMTFTQRILNSFVDIFSETSETLIKDMECHVNGEEYDISHYISRYLLDIINRTVMGVSMDVRSQKYSTYREMVNKTMMIIFSRMFKIWQHPSIIFYNTRTGRFMQGCLKYLHGFTNDIIKGKREAKKSNENDGSGDGFRALLDLWMDLEREGVLLTDKELQEEIDVMTTATVETSTALITFAILMLATHPKIQEKVHEELDEIYGSEYPSSTRVKHEHLRRMQYLERVIKETLRIFPPVPVIFRLATDDLQMGNYTLLKGTSILLGVLKMHRSEEHWKDPMTFDPDRFLPEECAKRHPFAYLPFSAGPRNCIGVNYAMMAVKTVLAMLLREHAFKKNKVVPLREIELESYLVLKPVVPITIRIEKRATR